MDTIIRPIAPDTLKRRVNLFLLFDTARRLHWPAISPEQDASGELSKFAQVKPLRS
ncbi:hypothetical protein [Dechloromonas hortensis]|uniref:hypothetical protein n=1 Tax=Dechloromonas hortensis TaxID=337779 RepID=UPI0012929809|nr:hypothetical protein [Dechloromonas hortensis]